MGLLGGFFGCWGFFGGGGRGGVKGVLVLVFGVGLGCLFVFFNIRTPNCFPFYIFFQLQYKKNCFPQQFYYQVAKPPKTEVPNGNFDTCLVEAIRVIAGFRKFFPFKGLLLFHT